MMYNANEKASFLTCAKYRDSFERLFAENKLMMIMIANSLVIRKKRIEKLCKEYEGIRSAFQEMTEAERIGLEDFTVVEEIVYHSRKMIDEMILALWMNRVGVSEIDNPIAKPIDSIGAYQHQKNNSTQQIILNEFDEFKEFMDEINAISNTYKHSILSYSPVETDMAQSKGIPLFFSYTLKPKDDDLRIPQDRIVKMLDLMFNRFLQEV